MFAIWSAIEVLLSVSKIVYKYKWMLGSVIQNRIAILMAKKMDNAIKF